MDTASKEWAAAQRTCAQQMLVLESLLRDHGSDASPQEELLRLLGSGSMSPAMNQFLSSTLGAPPQPLELLRHCIHSVLAHQYAAWLLMVCKCL